MNFNFPHLTIDRDSLPKWVVKGNTQFHNQHCGPAETAKDILTNFSITGYSFKDFIEENSEFCANLTPQVIWDWTNKLSDDFLEEIISYKKDLIQIPWSVGFSTESEEIQRKVFIEFTHKAHAKNLKVCAYFSLTNIFWKDAFAKEPFLKNLIAKNSKGEPITYGYFQSRYLACVSRPEWLDYVKNKVKMSIEQADVDAVYFDNLNAPCTCKICRQHFAEFTKKQGKGKLVPPRIKKRMPQKVRQCKEEIEVIISEQMQQQNFNARKHVMPRDYLWNRFQALRVTEALKEIRDYAFSLKKPLGFSANNHLEPHVNDVCNIIYSQDTRLPGKDWSNIPILRYLENDTEGWKQHITNHQLPAGHDPRLSMAEAMAYQGNPYQIIYKPYNLFYKNHPDLFTNLESTAKIGVFVEYPKGKMQSLQPLGLNNIQYDVICPDKWKTIDLEKYEVLVLTDTEMADKKLLKTLDELNSKGITIIKLDSNDKQEIFQEKIDLMKRVQNRMWEIQAPYGIATNLLYKVESDKYIMTLINYNQKPVGPVRIKLNAPSLKFDKLLLHSPDLDISPVNIVSSNNEFFLNKIDIFAIAELCNRI